MNVSGRRYSENDHVALANDLQTLHELGKSIISLSELMDWHSGEAADTEVADSVAITFDDGSWFDFYDIEHPSFGCQRSMFNILQDFQSNLSTPSSVHASSFVIASPEARTSLDKSCMVGNGWWTDEWWAEAAQSGLMAIECHSWDHVHPELDHVAQRHQLKGDFTRIDSFQDAEIQIDKAGDYICRKLNGQRPRFFAYPWGDVSDYVASHYLPTFRPRHQFDAAFTIDPRPVSKSDSRWRLPRYVCGRDWRSGEEFMQIVSPT